MAGLEALDETQPTGSGSLVDGDNAVRETRQKTKESVAKEHTLEGYHAIPMGTIVTIPTPEASHIGRVYFLEVDNSNEVLVWDGSDWVQFTRNRQTETNTTSITSHASSDPIDHANESVTRDKLKAGLLAKKHFIVGSNDNSLVDELVDGSTTTLHSHPAQAVSYPASLFTFVKVDVASGTAAQDWKTCSNTISSSIADGAKGVILEAVGKTKLQAEVLQERSLQPKIKIKKSGAPISDSMLLIGGSVTYNNLYSGITELGWRGQGMFPINDSKKFDYLVEDFNVEWEIRLVGYFL